MRFDLPKTPASLEKELGEAVKAQDTEDICSTEGAREVWEELSKANPQQIHTWVQNRLGTYPPTAQQWTLLLKVVAFLLLVAKVVLKRVLGKTS